ncbi:hypothetical protein [Acaryochloris marina]|uniref:hypothetical protein n=1 Tax=Acaryochloris marina TaxID=155978 RepID=UPI0021C3CF26|nr:hypothetical protein [Acaryochloris marina]BDM83564.1 hypothetical protein AM10699_64250 [Acaryochloris marina MBIC10699]
MNKTCGKCMYFNHQHQCCGIRLEEKGDLTSYLHREPTSEACKDFNIPDLPEFIQNQRTQKDLAMNNDDRDWRALPVVQIYTKAGGLRVAGTVEGLGNLLYAIAMAMGKGTGTSDLLLSNSARYTLTVERLDYESEWQAIALPPLNRTPTNDEPIDLDDLDVDFYDTF